MATDPMLASPRPAVCPACGAAVRTDVSWCGLCYASLAPLPEADADPASSADRQPIADAAASDLARSDLPPIDGVELGSSGDPAPARADDPKEVADQLIAQLAATRNPEPRWLAGLPRTPGAKAALMIGGVLVGSVVLLALMSLLGLLL